MKQSEIVKLKNTPGGVYIPCPVCKNGKVMRLHPETAGVHITLYCRRCKVESLVDIREGNALDRVTLRRIIA